MGHLINPHLVRLGVNNYSDTRWLSFSNINHSYLVTHDLFIHMYMKWFFRGKRRKINIVSSDAETYTSHYVILRTATSVHVVVICRMLDYHERWCRIMSDLILFVKRKKNKSRRRKNNRSFDDISPRVIPEWNDLKKPLYRREVSYKSPTTNRFDQVIYDDDILERFQNMHNAYYFSDELNKEFYGGEFNINEYEQTLKKHKPKYNQVQRIYNDRLARKLRKAAKAKNNKFNKKRFNKFNKKSTKDDDTTAYFINKLLVDKFSGKFKEKSFSENDEYIQNLRNKSSNKSENLQNNGMDKEHKINRLFNTKCIIYKYLKIAYVLEFIYSYQGYDKFALSLMSSYLLGSYCKYLQSFVSYLGIWGIFGKVLKLHDKKKTQLNNISMMNSLVFCWYIALAYKQKVNFGLNFKISNYPKKKYFLDHFHTLIFNRFYRFFYESRYNGICSYLMFIHICDFVEKTQLEKMNYSFYGSLTHFLSNYNSKDNVIKNLNLGFIRINSAVLTAPLINNYIIRNLKAGHSLNRIIYPMMRDAYKPWKQIVYRGWRIGGFGRFWKRGRAQKIWFKDGSLPLAMATSWVDYDATAMRLRNGMCTLKVFVTYKKLYIYNL